MEIFLAITEKSYVNREYSKILRFNTNIIRSFWAGTDKYNNESGYYFDIDGYNDEDYYYFCSLSDMPLDILEGIK